MKKRIDIDEILITVLLEAEMFVTLLKAGIQHGRQVQKYSD